MSMQQANVKGSLTRQNVAENVNNEPSGQLQKAQVNRVNHKKSFSTSHALNEVQSMQPHKKSRHLRTSKIIEHMEF